MHEIETWLLILTLFFPRIGLLLAWFSNQIPYNTIPFLGDVLLAVFLPRLLMVIYIAANIGYGGWFWMHLIGFLLSLTYHGSKTSKVMKEGKNPWDYKSYV